MSGSLLTDAKGRFAETIISTLLEYAGYRVHRLGVEEMVSEVKAALSRGEGTLQLPEQMRTAPDFLVVDPATGLSTLLEVKFRGTFDNNVAKALHSRLVMQINHWPRTVTAIICPDPQDLAQVTDIRQLIGCLKASDLERLVEENENSSKWKRLRTLGAIFERIADEQFYNQANALIEPIRAWSTNGANKR